jgi:WD40 repeat protein
MSAIPALACLLLALTAQAKQGKEKAPKNDPDAVIEQSDLVGPLAFSPDGLRIAGMYFRTTNVDNPFWEVGIFDIQTLRAAASPAHVGDRQTPAAENSRDALLMFSPDSAHIAAAGRIKDFGTSVHLTGLKNRESTSYGLMAYTGRIDAFAFSPGGDAIVTTGYDGTDGDPAGRKYTVRTWPIPAPGVDLRKPAKELELKLDSPDFLFGPKKGEIVAHPSELGFDIYELETGKRVRQVESRSGLGESESESNCACFSPDKKLLAIATATKATTVEGGRTGGRLRIWDVETGTVRHDLTQRDVARYVSFSPDGKAVAVTLSEKPGLGSATINIFEIGSAKLLRTIKGEFGFAAYEPIGRWLVAPSPKGLLFWKTGK